MKRKRKLGLVTTLMAALALLGATAAQASTITVGSVLPPGFTSEPFGEQVTLLNTTLPEKGANLVSPVNGVVVEAELGRTIIEHVRNSEDELDTEVDERLRQRIAGLQAKNYA